MSLSGLLSAAAPFIGGAIGASFGQPQLGAALGGAAAGALGGGSRPATTTGSNVASFQLPYLQQALQGAQQNYLSGGISPYPGSTVAPLSQVTLDSLGRIADPNATAGYSTAANALTNQLGALATAKPSKSSIGKTKALEQSIQDFKNQKIAQTGAASDNGLTAAAQRASGLQAERYGAADSGEQGYINSVLGGAYLNKNPYLDATYEQIARSLRGNIDSQYASGGRLQSGAAARGLATGLGDAATQLYGANYEAERARQGEAAQLAFNRSGQLNQVAGNNAAAQNALTQFGAGAQIEALNSLGQRQDQIGISNTGQTNAFNTAANQAAVQGQTGIFDATNKNNIANAAQANAFAANQAAALTTAANSLANIGGSQLGAYQTQLGAGNVLDQYGQRVLDANVSQYNQAQQQPFQNVANYLNAVNGNYGSSSTTSQPNNPITSALGGAATAVGAYNQLFPRTASTITPTTQLPQATGAGSSLNLSPSIFPRYNF